MHTHVCEQSHFVHGKWMQAWMSNMHMCMWFTGIVCLHFRLSSEKKKIWTSRPAWLHSNSVWTCRVIKRTSRGFQTVTPQLSHWEQSWQLIMSIDRCEHLIYLNSVQAVRLPTPAGSGLWAGYNLDKLLFQSCRFRVTNYSNKCVCFMRCLEKTCTQHQRENMLTPQTQAWTQILMLWGKAAKPLHLFLGVITSLFKMNIYK